MRIGIVGGTGTFGAAAARALVGRGHEVAVLSRRAPASSGDTTHRRIDLATGEGLPAALGGLETVVDASNVARPGRAMRRVMLDGTERLLRAEAQADVEQHVLISIVGIEHVPFSYYRVKLEQERRVREAPNRAGILRSTQFHQLLHKAFVAARRARILPAGRILLQPVDPAEVAQTLADRIDAGPWEETLETGGPEILTLGELARAWRQVTGQSALLLPIPPIGRIGRALEQGALTTAEASRGTTTFGDWLHRL